MTPSQKAAELIEKFKSSITYCGQTELDILEDSKDCAIIAVDEIMLICPYLSKENADTLEQLRASDEYFTSYWQQVKTEIEKS